MVLENLFKLEKLKIESFSDRERTSDPKEFEAMFNPESFNETYGIVYQENGTVSGVNSQAQVIRAARPNLRLKLVLDGTGVSEMGILQLTGPKSVSDRVNEFLEMAYERQGETHENRFLKISWGKRWGTKASGGFECRLQSVDIEYTSFDRDGSPLRAVLDLTLIWDQDSTKSQAIANLQSADLTHGRVVKAGDTLPLLTKAVYGSSEHYLRVAQANDLDDFRNLSPGQEIFFPPLEK